MVDTAGRSAQKSASGEACVKAPIALWRAAVGLGVVGLWEAAVATGVVDAFFVSRPSAIAGRMWVWVSTGFVWSHLAITLQESILGLLIGSILGTVSGFALARSTMTAKVLEPYIMMLNAVPRVLLAPLFLLWFGLGIWSKVALSVTLVFFIMFFNAYQGVRQADPVLIENARMLGATERQLVRHVLVPSALTWIFSSLQASLGFAMIGAVVGEYLGATRGLGYVISQAEGTFDTTGVFSGMAILSLVVVVMSRGVARAEDWLLRWKRPLIGLLVAVVAAAGSSACRQAGHDAGAPVRIAIGGQTQMVYLPTTLTQELGFYKEEGVEVELQDFEGGAKALQALIGGSADVVSGFYDHTIQMAAEGRQLTAFVVMLRYPGLVLLTSPQAADRITSVSALEGGIAGVTTPGSSSHLFLNVLLAQHKVPIQSVSVTASEAVPRRWPRSNVAGSMRDGWEIPRSRFSGGAIPACGCLQTCATSVARVTPSGPASYPSAVLYTETSWLEAHRDTAARLARAIVKTLRWMQAHSEEEIAAKVPPALRGEDFALYVDALKNSRPMFSTDGVMPADGAAAVHDVLAASNPKVKGASIALSKTYTNEFISR